MKRLMVIFGLVVGLVGFMTIGSAQAVAVLDFGTGLAGSGGSIVSSGGNYSGSDIPVDSLIVTGTSHNGTYVVWGTGSDAFFSDPANTSTCLLYTSPSPRD